MDTQTQRPASSGLGRAVAAGPPPAPSAAPQPRKGAARPAPVRNADYGHLSIEALREYRRALAAEEGNVSYWRRILQARLDVLQAGAGGRQLDRERLRPLLTTERVGAGRRALVEILPVDDIPSLPSLGELWDRRVDSGDAHGQALLEQDLRDAERQLSEYRSALHRRIADATSEMIARYREEPALCLSALPLEPRRSAATA